MQTWKLLSLMLVGILLFGCSENQKNEDNPAQPMKTPVDGDKNDTVTPPPAEKISPAPQNFEWVYVQEVLDITPEDLAEIEAKLKATFLKDLSYKKFTPAEYDAQMANLEGKKVIKVKISYAYGNFDLSLLRSTIDKIDGDLVEAPIEGLLDHRIEHGEDLERFLKEIDYKMREEQKQKEN